MKRSGSIRPTKWSPRRSVTSKSASPLLSFPQGQGHGTVRLGPQAFVSGPNSSPAFDLAELLYRVTERVTNLVTKLATKIVPKPAASNLTFLPALSPGSGSLLGEHRGAI